MKKKIEQEHWDNFELIESQPWEGWSVKLLLKLCVRGLGGRDRFIVILLMSSWIPRCQLQFHMYDRECHLVEYEIPPGC